MQMCNIRCFNERLRLDWSSIAMATELSNRQMTNAHDLKYITAFLSTVFGGIMNASTITQAMAARPRLHLK